MDDLLTTAQAAAALGLSVRRVQAIARARGVGRLVGRQRLYLRADLEALRPGRPGNHSGRPRTGKLANLRNSSPNPLTNAAQ